MFSLSMPSLNLALAVTILHVLLAATVTVDVLLKKSDVRGALGWIGVAWFSPILGGLFYYMFGINRVTRRGLRMHRLSHAQVNPPDAAPLPDAPEHIRDLLEVGARLTGGPLTSGNSLTVLEGGDAAYPQMLAAIAGARQSIAMASYVFRDDAAGREFADALIAAHKRGVTVRVLLDSMGIGYIYPKIFHTLLDGGVTAARFLHTWLPWRMPFLKHAQSPQNPGG